MNWISVKERLPEVDDEYIVFAARINEVMTADGWDGRHFYYFSNRNDEEKETMEIITHWMPLPEPPKEGR